MDMIKNDQTRLGVLNKILASIRGSATSQAGYVEALAEQMRVTGTDLTGRIEAEAVLAIGRE